MDSFTIDIDGNVNEYGTVKSAFTCTKLNFPVSWGHMFYTCCLLLATLIFLCIILFLCEEYIRGLLLWVESQEQWIIYIIFALLFTIISFPFTWGYTFLIIATGFFFGILRGFVTVLFSVNLGVVIAHFTIRMVNSKFPLTKFLPRNEKVQAVLSVISGPKAFRVAVFSRLTPVPFGLQNLIFAASSINTRIYFIASFLGLIPAQLINVCLGSSLRSMEEVLSHKSAATGVIVFFQICVGVSLMAYVLIKAREELKKTLYTTSYNQLA